MPQLPTVPLTRTLPALLRREIAGLRRTKAGLFVAEVTAVPSAASVTISYGDATATIPRLASYGTATVGKGCYVLACGPIVIAIGEIG